MKYTSFYFLCITFAMLSFSLSGMDLTLPITAEIELTNLGEPVGEQYDKVKELMELLKKEKGDLSQLTPEEKALIQEKMKRLQGVLYFKMQDVDNSFAPLYQAADVPSQPLLADGLDESQVLGCGDKIKKSFFKHPVAYVVVGLFGTSFLTSMVILAVGLS